MMNHTSFNVVSVDMDQYLADYAIKKLSYPTSSIELRIALNSPRLRVLDIRTVSITINGKALKVWVFDVQYRANTPNEINSILSTTDNCDCVVINMCTKLCQPDIPYYVFDMPDFKFDGDTRGMTCNLEYLEYEIQDDCAQIQMQLDARMMSDPCLSSMHSNLNCRYYEKPIKIYGLSYFVAATITNLDDELFAGHEMFFPVNARADLRPI